jgi:hypothetical protein
MCVESDVTVCVCAVNGTRAERSSRSVGVAFHPHVAGHDGGPIVYELV